MEQYCDDIKNEYHEIKKKFSRLVTAVFESLKRRIEYSSVKTLLLRHLIIVCGYSSEDTKVLEAAKSIDEISLVIIRFSSFCNAEVFEALIETYGSEEDKKHLQEYDRDFRQCCFTVHNNRVKCGKLIHSSQRVVSFKIDYNMENMNGNEIQDLKSGISRIIEVPSAQLKLIEIRAGCLDFHFVVPLSVCDQVFQLNDKHREELLKGSVRFIEIFVSSDEVCTVHLLLFC